jgi:hypothetical protein
MADFGTPVAGQQPPQSGLATLQSLMSLKSQAQSQQLQQQSLQSGALGIQQKQMENTGTQISLGERQNVQQIMASGKDPSGHAIKDANGDVDMDYAPNWLTKAAPTTWPDYMDKFQTVASNKLTIAKASSDLQAGLRDQIGAALQTGVNDPGFNSQKAATVLAPIGAANPSAAPAIASAIAQIKNADGIPDQAKKNDVIVHTIQAFRPSAANQPAQVDTGPSIQPGATQPGTGAFTPAGAPIAKALTPEQRLPHQMTNAANKILNVSPGGAISAPPQGGGGPPQVSAKVGHGAGAATAAPPMPREDLNPSSAQAAAAVDTSKSVAQNVDNTRTADQDFGTNQHINDQLLALSKDTSTGYGSEGWRKAVGYISGGRISSPDFQTIGAYLDRSSAMAAKSMGLPNTNAGLETAAGATGTTQYSPEALQTKVKLAQALNTAAHQFRQGQDQAVGQGAAPDPTAYNQFRADWSKNFDPRIFLMENAHRLGTPDESKAIAGKMSAAEKTDLQQKRANLLSLAQTGHLAQ